MRRREVESEAQLIIGRIAAEPIAKFVDPPGDLRGRVSGEEVQVVVGDQLEDVQQAAGRAEISADLLVVVRAGSGRQQQVGLVHQNVVARQVDGQLEVDIAVRGDDRRVGRTGEEGVLLEDGVNLAPLGGLQRRRVNDHRAQLGKNLTARRTAGASTDGGALSAAPVDEHGVLVVAHAGVAVGQSSQGVADFDA